MNSRQERKLLHDIINKSLEESILIYREVRKNA